MTADATWDDLIAIVRMLADVDAGPPLRGTFVIAQDVDLRSLQACLQAGQDTHLILVDDQDPASLAAGQTVRISVAPRLGFGQIKRDMDDLLDGYRQARVREPRFFLLDDRSTNSDHVGPDHRISRYRAVLGFIQTLKKAAAFLDTEDATLVFIDNGKFEMPIEYGASDLALMPLAVIQALADAIPPGTHEKEYASILAESVVSLTERLPIEQRFRHLLINASALQRRFEQGYQLFAAGFSYEKVRDDIEAARVEYSGKIHKVFADVQNQLLGIPVATIIVATQMKDAKAVGYEFWVNTAVLAGCWVFAVLMMFLLYNQASTLRVLSDETDRQRRQLTRDYAAVAGSLSDAFTFLSRRARMQRIILRVIAGFVVLGLVLSHLVYFELTPPALAWVRAFL